MAVLFDLDDTLCVDDQNPAALLAATFDRVGVDPFCDASTLASTGTEQGNADSDIEFYREQFRIAAERAAGSDADAPAPDDPEPDHTLDSMAAFADLI
ncbi:hypothetical protein [Halobaculum litoreum]|uniref:hypothetical protein n=1 Tax=Halobaculum litoreum TaxID=3031998 RepID=UPI0024C2DE6C|nr:hypothetical protein [Halobaculum sp. DT92]